MCEDHKRERERDTHTHTILAISCTLEGCTMYYGTHDIILLVIVDMDKEDVAFYFATSSIFVVEEEG